METRRPRALRILPTLAAVMPLPRLLVTPPVTKTYFAMGRGSSGVFLMLQNPGPEGESPHARRRGGGTDGGRRRPRRQAPSPPRSVQRGGQDPSGGSLRPGPQTSGPQKNGCGGGAPGATPTSVDGSASKAARTVASHASISENRVQRVKGQPASRQIRSRSRLAKTISL